MGKLTREQGRHIISQIGRGSKGRLNKKMLYELKQSGVAKADRFKIKKNRMNSLVGDTVMAQKARDKALVAGSAINRHKGKIAVGAATLGTAAVIKRKNDNRKNGTTDKVKPVGKTKLNTKNKRRSN